MKRFLIYTLLLVAFHVEAKKDIYSMVALSPTQVESLKNSPSGTLSFDSTLYQKNGILTPPTISCSERKTLSQGIYFGIYASPNLTASKMPTKSYEVLLSIRLEFKDSIGISRTTNINLQINYDNLGSPKYKSKNEYYLQGTAYCRYYITNFTIKDTNGNTIRSNDADSWFYFKTYLQVERFYQPRPSETVPGTPHIRGFFANQPLYVNTFVTYQKSSDNGYITVSWNPTCWAEYYELEYTYIDNYGLNLGTKTVLKIKFRFNSTRIQANSTSYTIPNVFERGAIACRVRPVGLWGKDFDQPIPGQWTLSDEFENNTALSLLYPSANHFLYYIDSPHEVDKKNWQIITSFAEEAKSKSVVTYFDGTFRNRQSQTNLSTNKTIVVAESIYDHQGRPSIEFLPAPVYGIGSESPALRYRNRFNVNSAGNNYSKSDFDLDPVTTSCQTVPNPAANSAGASNYYSTANTQKIGLQGLVPDAEGYPFVQKEYTTDGTERIRRLGSPGREHHLGTNQHETKYEYGKPEQEELDRLFGNDAGYAKYYTKDMVIDGNGQSTITIKNNSGKVVATALAGVTPESLDTLLSQVSNTTTINLSGPEANKYNLIDNQLKAESKLIISVPTVLNVSYNINDVNFDIGTCSTQPNICYSCNYDVRISIRDNKCNTVVMDTSFNIGTLNDVMNCSIANNVSFNKRYTVQKGTYDVQKILSINQSSLDSVVNNYVKNICVENKIRVWIDEEKKDDPSSCLEKCKQCDTVTVTRDIIVNGAIQTVRTVEPILDGNCSTTCDPVKMLINEPCSLGYGRMLNDLTPPSGQYAKVDNSDPLSYFNSSSTNQLGVNWLQIAWSKSITNLDSLSAHLQTNPTEVQKLIAYHPEYCYYAFCTANADLARYNEELKALRLSEAFVRFGTVALKNTNFLDDIYRADPLIGRLTTIQKGDFEDDLKNILRTLKDSICPAVTKDYNIIEASIINASGLKLPTATQITTYLSNNLPRFLTTGASEEQWSQYKNLYLQVRQKYFETFREATINGYGGCTDAVNKHLKIANQSNAIWKDKIPVFPTRKQNNNIIENRVENQEISIPVQNCTPPFINPPDTYSSCGVCQTADNLMYILNEVSRGGKILDSRPIEGTMLSFLNFDGSWNPFLLGSPAVGYYPTSSGNMLKIRFESSTKNCDLTLNLKSGAPDLLKNVYAFYCIKDTTLATLPVGVPPQNAFVIKAILKDATIVEMVGYSTCFKVGGCKPPKSKQGCENKNLIDEALNMAKNDILTQRGNEYYNRTSLSASLPAFRSKLSSGLQNPTRIISSWSSVGPNIVFQYQIILDNDDKKHIFMTMTYDRLYWKEIPLVRYVGYNIIAVKDSCESKRMILKYINRQEQQVKVLVELSSKLPLSFTECCINPDDLRFCCMPPTVVPPGTFNPPLTCDDINDPTNDSNIRIKREQYIRYLSDSIRTVYTERCLKMAQATEALRLNYGDIQHHYTLYYYDQADNLVQTVPPKGVASLSVSEVAQVDNFRKNAAGSAVYPAHTFKTTYTYNSLNAILLSSSPDGGSIKYCYDELGRIIMSQDAVQQRQRRVTYTKYDKLGRVIQSGTINRSGGILPKLPYVTFLSNLASNRISIDEVVTNFYNNIPTSFTDFPLNAYFTKNKQENTYNRIVATVKHKSYDTTRYDHAFFYSYDIHGNVKELVQDTRVLNAALSLLSVSAKRFHRVKTMKYSYDLISDKITKMTYQSSKADEFTHEYTYDADNRITKVQTYDRPWVSNDFKDTEAQYQYYDHGPLARTVIGHEQVQGLDQYYNIMGWLKGINSPYLTPNNDPSQDGSKNSTVAADVLGLALGYYTNDYRPIATPTAPFLANETGEIGNSLYNGNIRNMYTSIGANTGSTNPLQLRAFRYDALSRLTQATVHNISSLSNAAPNPIDNYKETFSYDANGNILRLGRNNATAQPLDALTYSYGSTNNRLNAVTDRVGRVDAALKDLDSASNFLFDEKGRLSLIDERGNGGVDRINSIKWSNTDKLLEINKDDGTNIKYTYNAQDQRILKVIDNLPQPVYHYDVRDLQGHIIASYDINKTDNKATWTEVNLYGSSRIGIWEPQKPITAATAGPILISPGTRLYTDTLWRGQKQYELNNHLGNVLVNINDRKFVHITSTDTTARPYVLSATDYYAFGSPMPNRGQEGDNYRYGFNGMDKDNETSGNGNHYTTLHRQFDPRLGRWWTVDPEEKEYPDESPYVAMENNPIFETDPDGDCPWCIAFVKGAVQEYATQVITNVAEGKDWKKALTDVDGGEILKSGAIDAITLGVGSLVGKAKSVVKLTKAADKAMDAEKAAMKASKVAKTTEKVSKVEKSAVKAESMAAKAEKAIPCGCFTEKTKVLIKGNIFKAIKDITVGDSVWAYNEMNRKLELKKVLRTFSYKRDTTFIISILDTKIETTSDHPFFIGGKWVIVSNLHQGDSVQLYSGEKAIIQNIEVKYGSKIVYNFEVEKNHTYYVSSRSVLVHNSGPCKDLLPTKRAQMRQAKRDAGIPTSQTHTSHKTVDAAKSGKSGIPGKEYYFESTQSGGQKVTKTLQDHHSGHKFIDGTVDKRPHWNNHQPEGVSGATNTHYYYKKK